MSKPAHFIGIDIGGTNIKAVAVSEMGELLASTQFPTHDSEFAEWAPKVKTLMSQWQIEIGETAGIGVASPGIVSPGHRTVSWMKGRMEAVCGFEWTDYLQTPFFVPVLNDAKAALVAEAWIGAAIGTSNAFLLTLGTGVGGAAIVDGQLLHGALGRSGHLGHISLDPYGASDIVGTPGSLEDWIGGATLATRTKNRYADTEALVKASEKGDPDASRIWLAAVKGLAAGIVSLINVLDPEIVILGGGITAAGDSLFAPLASAIEQIEWRPFGPGVAVVPAQLDEHAGAIGAARFAMTFAKEFSSNASL